MTGVKPPNYTQIPNEILDKMGEMTPAEFKVLMAICRKTFGWHKDRDVISLSQLEDITKLSRTAVQAGIMAAIKRGLLERTKVGNQSFSYHLLVASDYQSTETTSSVNGTEQVVSGYRELVASDYTQKKDLKKKESGGVQAREETPPPPFFDPVAGLMTLGLKRSQAVDAAALQTFTPELIDLLAAWKVNYRGKSAVGGLCSYLKDGDLPNDLPQPKRSTTKGPVDYQALAQEYRTKNDEIRNDPSYYRQRG